MIGSEPAAREPAVRLEGVSKRFRRYRNRHHHASLKAAVAATLRRESPRRETVLSNLDLEVARGDCLALLGANGAGKTTLLRLIAGIYRPDAGRVLTRGRVATLLELGTGFHEDLSGRENVRVNAAILGLSRLETERRMDSILEFAGLADWAAAPVRIYSSGMIVRLAFSVAVQMEPDILLIDEVLSVGDKDFRRKSLDTICRLRDAGTTVLFASHEAPIVSRLATRAVLVEGGKLAELSLAADAIRSYFS